MKLLKRIAAVGFLCAPVAALAAAPTAEEIKKVTEFYEKGQGQGIVLVDAVACLEVEKDGDRNCAKEVPPEGVKAGTMVNLWQMYTLPKGDAVEDITVQVKLGEQVRETKDVAKIEGKAMLRRTWTGVTLKKPGNYTFVIMRGADTLKSISVVAN